MDSGHPVTRPTLKSPFDQMIHISSVPLRGQLPTTSSATVQTNPGNSGTTQKRIILIKPVQSTSKYINPEKREQNHSVRIIQSSESSSSSAVNESICNQKSSAPGTSLNIHAATNLVPLSVASFSGVPAKMASNIGSPSNVVYHNVSVKTTESITTVGTAATIAEATATTVVDKPGRTVTAVTLTPEKTAEAGTSKLGETAAAAATSTSDRPEAAATSTFGKAVAATKSIPGRVVAAAASPGSTVAAATITSGRPITAAIVRPERTIAASARLAGSDSAAAASGKLEDLKLEKNKHLITKIHSAHTESNLLNQNIKVQTPCGKEIVPNFIPPTSHSVEHSNHAATSNLPSHSVTSGRIDTVESVGTKFVNLTTTVNESVSSCFPSFTTTSEASNGDCPNKLMSIAKESESEKSPQYPSLISQNDESMRVKNAGSPMQICSKIDDDFDNKNTTESACISEFEQSESHEINFYHRDAAYLGGSVEAAGISGKPLRIRYGPKSQASYHVHRKRKRHKRRLSSSQLQELEENDETKSSNQKILDYWKETKMEWPYKKLACNERYDEVRKDLLESTSSSSDGECCTCSKEDFNMLPDDDGNDYFEFYLDERLLRIKLKDAMWYSARSISLRYMFLRTADFWPPAPLGSNALKTRRLHIEGIQWDHFKTFVGKLLEIREEYDEPLWEYEDMMLSHVSIRDATGLLPRIHLGATFVQPAPGLHGPIYPVYGLTRDQLYVDKLFTRLLDIETSRRCVKWQYISNTSDPNSLLFLPDDLILRIIRMLNSEDLANIADTCMRLRKLVRQMTLEDESPPSSQYSIESIDGSELESTCQKT